MKITWLTQAGLLFDNGKIKIMVDPYLSDSVGKRSPEKHRRIPVDESFFEEYVAALAASGFSKYAKNRLPISYNNYFLSPNLLTNSRYLSISCDFR